MVGPHNFFFVFLLEDFLIFFFFSPSSRFLAVSRGFFTSDPFPFCLQTQEHHRSFRLFRAPRFCSDDVPSECDQGFSHGVVGVADVGVFCWRSCGDKMEPYFHFPSVLCRLNNTKGQQTTWQFQVSEQIYRAAKLLQTVIDPPGTSAPRSGCRSRSSRGGSHTRERHRESVQTLDPVAR